LAGEKKPPFRSAYEALAVSAVVIRLRQFFFGPCPALVRLPCSSEAGLAECLPRRLYHIDQDAAPAAGPSRFRSVPFSERTSEAWVTAANGFLIGMM
jgi:hypothetical protein